MNGDLLDRVHPLGSETWKGRGVSQASGVSDVPQRNKNNIPDLLRTMPVMAVTFCVEN